MWVAIIGAILILVLVICVLLIASNPKRGD